MLNSRVASVRDKYVAIVNKEGVESEIPFGACVWATGIAMNPLIKQLQEVLPGQTHFRSILTDDYLRVKGSDGSIWAFGDASTIDQPKALDYADELFEKADVNKVSLPRLDSTARYHHVTERFCTMSQQDTTMSLQVQLILQCHWSCRYRPPVHEPGLA